MHAIIIETPIAYMGVVVLSLRVLIFVGKTLSKLQAKRYLEVVSSMGMMEFTSHSTPAPIMNSPSQLRPLRGAAKSGTLAGIGVGVFPA